MKLKGMHFIVAHEILICNEAYDTWPKAQNVEKRLKNGCATGGEI